MWMPTLQNISSETAVIIGTTIFVIFFSALLLGSQKRKERVADLGLGLKDLLLDTNEIEWDNGNHSKDTTPITPPSKESVKNDPDDEFDASAPEKEKSGEGGEPKLKNVFDVKQTPPKNVVGVAQDLKGVEKPFKSSYYYAHNQHRKTGGYSDGLKAEDYVMNGPKLLNKGSSMETSAHNVATSAQAATKPGKGNSIPINRYLWDDGGKENGIAKIYIDSLPGKGSETSISWADAQITKNNIMNKLVGVGKKGLIVQIRSLDKRYHLYIPCMHGEVEEVKTVLKANKLIVKLIKKKEKENLKSWPQLPSKVVKSTSDGVDYVNQDLFLQD